MKERGGRRVSSSQGMLGCSYQEFAFSFGYVGNCSGRALVGGASVN